MCTYTYLYIYTYHRIYLYRIFLLIIHHPIGLANPVNHGSPVHIQQPPKQNPWMELGNFHIPLGFMAIMDDLWGVIY